MEETAPRLEVERLSPRMRQCLRRVFARRTTKQIAADLGLSPGTVDGYIAEAVRLLGARSRVEAAELLHAAEADAGADFGPDANGPVAPATPELPPCELAPRSTGVSVGTVAAPGEGLSAPAVRRLPLPIRTQGASGNDLSIVQRIGWVVLLAIGIAVGIGGVANALRVASDLARRG